MRRLLVALGVVVGLVALAMPAGASAIHFSQSGPGAEAFFSDFPQSGNPVPGTVYTDTYLTVAQNAVNANGQKFTDKFLYIDMFSYKFDRQGNFIPASDTSGYAEGADVSLSAAKDLSSASTSATVSLTVCTFDRHFNETCSDGGTATVTGSWTGQGPKSLENGKFIFHSKGITEVSRFHGFFRNATATAAVGGTPVPGGSSLYADIFNASSKDVCVSPSGGCGF